MDRFNLLKETDLETLVVKRPNEIKFGEQLNFLTDSQSIYEQIKSLDVSYIIFGIKEDLGVLAHYGTAGTSRAWDATIKVLLNIQNNSFLKSEKTLVLGHFDFTDYPDRLDKWNDNPKKWIKKARKLLCEIDKQVTYLTQLIVSAGKVPIVVGGGQNNSYGLIKGSALALKTPLNAINFDAHPDFRPEEGRHSGNGFSYAYAEGFLKNYFVFGLHENYTSDIILRTIKKIKSIKYITFEELRIRKEIGYKKAIELGIEHVNTAPFGLEIDCDAIQGMPSNNKSPSGFTTLKSRNFVHLVGQESNVVYFHISEASPDDNDSKDVGKLISFLITDFIKAHEG